MTHFGGSREKRSEELRHVLHRALDRSGLRKRLGRRIPPEVWAQAVGPQLAARVQPTVLCGGVLNLLVEDYRWRDQIDAARSMVIERINRRLGGTPVRELRFGLAHDGALANARGAASLPKTQVPQVPLLEPSLVLGRSQLEPSLREALLRAAEAAQRRRPPRS